MLIKMVLFFNLKMGRYEYNYRHGSRVPDL